MSLNLLMTTKRRTLTEEDQEDIRRLREIFETRKKSAGLTQSQLADLCGWESQGTVAQYFGKKLPLNLDAAFRLSKALEVSLDAISPRLAAKAVELFGATLAAKEAPQTIDGLLLSLQDEINSADNDVRLAIADLVKAYKNDPAEGARIAKAIRAFLGLT
jgi:transcriptional regulator with XRE-family HTH domain